MWVYRGDFGIGHELGAGDVMQQRENVTSSLGQKSFVSDKPSGRSVNRHVRKGRIVYREDLNAPAMITRLSRVDLLVTSGPIRIQTEGIAQSMGWNVGDPVRVRLPDSNTVLEGVVSGRGAVRVAM